MAKKTYTQPELRKHGSVEQLTLQGVAKTADGNDGNNAQGNMMNTGS